MTAHRHSETTVRPECCRVCSHVEWNGVSTICWGLDDITETYMADADTCPPSWCPLPAAAQGPSREELQRDLATANAQIAALREAQERIDRMWRASEMCSEEASTLQTCFSLLGEMIEEAQR